MNSLEDIHCENSLKIKTPHFSIKSFLIKKIENLRISAKYLDTLTIPHMKRIIKNNTSLKIRKKKGYSKLLTDDEKRFVHF